MEPILFIGSAFPINIYLNINTDYNNVYKLNVAQVLD